MVLYEDGKKKATMLVPMAIQYDFHAAKDPLHVNMVTTVVLPLPESALEQLRTVIREKVMKKPKCKLNLPHQSAP